MQACLIISNATYIKTQLMEVYSHYPCEKPLMKGFLLNRAKDLFR